MATIQQGSVTIELGNDVALPERAGHLSPKEISHIARPPHGIGLVCEQTADAMESAGESFFAPEHLSPDRLRQLGQRAERNSHLILDAKAALAVLEQTELLDEAEAWDAIRQVNDLLKAQVKRDSNLARLFAPTLAYFAKLGTGNKHPGHVAPAKAAE